MNSLEGAGIDFRLELTFRRIGGEVNILRTHYHIHGHILAETGVHAVEFVLDERHAVIAYHPAFQDVALADEVRHEAVDWFVVDVFRSADLLDFAFVHNHDSVRKRKGFFLVVGHINEGDSELLVHLLKLYLHVLAHLEIKRAEGLVQKQDLGPVH